MVDFQQKPIKDQKVDTGRLLEKGVNTLRLINSKVGSSVRPKESAKSQSSVLKSP
jgi:hypothetical protein